MSFTQAPGQLLTFAPVAATSLTDSNGQASIDISAASPTSTGAVTVEASTSVGTASATGQESLEITATPSTGTTPTPAAINFVSSVPSGTAIVIKGAGGSGRSESAVLTFKVVDGTGAPINAAKVDFTLNAGSNGLGAGGATLSQTSGISNSDGTVTVSVQSGSEPASIVVSAASDAVPSVTAQSDTLIVSNSVPVAGGFEIVADKYNLDGRKTGDTATLTAFVRDQFGNPVPDGVAVSLQTDYGVVASSTLGGCVTVDGTCTASFRVQDPRGDGLATVVGSVRVGTSTVLSTEIQINMAGSTGLYEAKNEDSGFTVATSLVLTSCQQSFELLLSDGSDGNNGEGRSVAAGTVITAPFASTGVSVAIETGTPVLDQLVAGFRPTTFGFQVDLTSTSLVAPCVPGGTVKPSQNYLRFDYTSPGGIDYPQRLYLSYPQ